MVVSGEQSKEVTMSNMVYQGTVLGPPLWNIFYADSKDNIQDCGYTELIYADDLNAYKEHLNSGPNDVILSEMKTVQTALHKWGKYNRVTFDAGKEGFFIISKISPFLGRVRLNSENGSIWMQLLDVLALVLDAGMDVR